MTFFLKKLFFLSLLASIAFMHSIDSYRKIIKKGSKEIKNGQIITLVQEDLSKEQNKAYITGIAFFNSDAQEILKIIKDLENYHTFMPNIEKVEIYNVTDIGIEANYYAKLPFGIRKKYRLLHRESRIKNIITFNWEKIDWPGLSIEETLNDVDGEWHLIEDEDGTFVIYSAYLDAGYIPWGIGWLVNSFTKKTVKSILEETRNKCKLTQ